MRRPTFEFGLLVAVVLTFKLEVVAPLVPKTSCVYLNDIEIYISDENQLSLSDILCPIETRQAEALQRGCRDLWK